MMYLTDLPDRVYQRWLRTLQRFEDKYKIERGTDLDYLSFQEWLEANEY
jgi:hypothetical protein